MNRAVVIERLCMIQDRLNDLTRVEGAMDLKRSEAVRGVKRDRAGTLQQIVFREVRPIDAEISAIVGWLAGYATHAGFPSDITGMCKALEITPEIVDEIERGEFPRTLDPELATSVYETVKRSIKTVLHDKLTKVSNTLIIRSTDTSLVDEIARGVAQGVLGIIEAEKGK